MKKLTITMTLIGVLALAACGNEEDNPGTQETGADQNQVEENGMDDAGGSDTEDDPEDKDSD